MVGIVIIFQRVAWHNSLDSLILKERAMPRTATTRTTAVASKKTTARRPVRTPLAAVATKAAPTKTTVRPAAKSLPRKPAVKAVAKPLAAKDIKGAVANRQKKQKLVRDSFSFPAHEHALLAEMKKRALKLGKEFKKSEILRAGIAHLSGLADAALVAILSKVERVKTGRPAKKGKKK